MTLAAYKKLLPLPYMLLVRDKQSDPVSRTVKPAVNFYSHLSYIFEK